MTRPFALSPAQQRRVEKLARDAGRSAGETLRFVLRDGFEFCEWEVRESRAADAETGRRIAANIRRLQRIRGTRTASRALAEARGERLAR